MNEDEKKAWEELVARGVRDIGVQVHADYMDRVILAADVEIKRLREVLRNIVQWADPCWTGGCAGDQPHPAWEDVQEGRAALKSADAPKEG